MAPISSSLTHATHTKAAPATATSPDHIKGESAGLKAKYSLSWASAVSKVNAANKFAAAAREHATRRENEGRPTGGTSGSSSPRTGESEPTVLEGLRSSRPASAKASPREHLPKISYSLSSAKPGREIV